MLCSSLVTQLTISLSPFFVDQDEGAYAKLVDSIKSNFNDRYEDFKKWGGGIMGAKSQERTRQKEKAVAREAAKRMQA